jgi:hypothetical protein
MMVCVMYSGTILISKIFSDNSKISLKELARFICKGFKEQLD